MAHKIYTMSFASVYPLYVAKAEKKGRTKAEVDQIICWLTGHTQKTLDKELAKKTSFENFFAHAPRMNASRSLITGTICGVRVENIEEPIMVLSGSQSALAGGFFIFQASMPVVPSIADVAGYAAVGALYFLVSAVWLTVGTWRRRAAT